MRSPFAKERTDDQRRTLWERLTQPSSREIRDAEGVMSEARMYVQWRRAPFATKFDEWLEKESHRAVPVGDPTSMIVSATRSNTFREVIGYLRGMDERARLALGEDDG